MESLDKKMTAELDRLFRRSRRVCTVSHLHPDGDALGSSTALVSYLRSRGLEAVALVPDAYPDSLSFLAEGGRVVVASEEPSRAVAVLAEADLVVCLDFNSPSRAGELEPSLRASASPKVMIDHHPQPEVDGFELVFSETEVSSASELLFHVLMSMPDVASDASRLPHAAAVSLMAGMTTDTNNFANSVFPSTFSMASALLAAGVDRGELLSRLYSSYRENRFRAMGVYLKDKMHITEYGVAYSIFNKEDIFRLGLKDGDTEGFVNLPLGIGKVVMSIFLREDGGFYRVSVRSKAGWSSNALARAFFHGGGHECAAGGKLLFPGDIALREEAGHYIEMVTARFLQSESPSEKDEL